MNEGWYGIIGVLIGASIGTTTELVRGYFKRKNNAEYLAVRLICELDRFILLCVDVVDDDGTIYGQYPEDGYPQIQKTQPEFELPTGDIDWKVLSVKLMYEVMNFTNEINKKDRSLQVVFDLASGPDEKAEAMADRQYNYALLGVKATDLKYKFCRKYSLNLPLPILGEWNAEDYLLHRKSEMDQHREEKEKPSYKFMAY